MAEGKFDLPDDLIFSKSSDQLKELASDNSIPLSPQWLYTKSSEYKMDVRSPTPVPMGNPSDPNPKDAWRLDAPEDKKDWKKIVHENETSRRWREEERETGLLGARKVDRRKTERRIDSVSSRETGDIKNAAASDRWNDVNSRAAVHEPRRDNKWSSRWGPDDKEKEARCEKVDINKDKEEPQSESQSVVSNVRATSERDSDTRDKWRPRHRMESQSGGPSSYRAAPGFGLDRGRAEGPNLGFTVGRGRASTIGRGSSTSLIGAGSASAPVFRYPRGKLLDMYRKQKPDPSLGRIPTEMDEVASITQVALIAFAFLDYLERRLSSDEKSTNLLEKLQDAVGRGQDAMSILPKSSMEPEIITIAEPEVEESATRYTYDRFPASVRSEEQEEKRKQILAAASGALESNGRHPPSSPPGKNTKVVVHPHLEN